MLWDVCHNCLTIAVEGDTVTLVSAQECTCTCHKRAEGLLQELVERHDMEPPMLTEVEWEHARQFLSDLADLHLD